jgi:HD-like signal output (HDOD) protein
MGTNLMEQPILNACSLESLVSNTASLISLPEIYVKFKQLTEDEASDVTDFAELVTMDSNLTSAVLKVINSPLYGFSGQIDAIDRAINLLGLGQLHDLILALSAVNAISTTNDIEPLKAFWRRSIYCGVMARLLAEEKGVRDVSGMFVIGLLHEIGRMLLFIKQPDATRYAIDDARACAISLAQSETKIFGYHYGQVGAALLASWNLPAKVFSVVEHHLQPSDCEHYYTQASILGASHCLAAQARTGVDPYSYTLEHIGTDAIEISESALQALLPQAEQLSQDMESMIIKG